MRIRFFSLFAVLIISFLFCTPVLAAGDGTELHTMSVDGRGAVETQPDQATVSIGVATRAREASAAQSESAARVRSVIDAVRGLGIGENDIRTSSYSFHPFYRRTENRENEIEGYEVENSVTVSVRDISLAGKVIDAALGSGANQVHSLEFHVSDTQKIRRQALLAAIRDAKEKAETIASGLGCRIVGIHHVSESTGDFVSREYNVAMMSKAVGDSTPVENGMVSLEARVSIEFILDK